METRNTYRQPQWDTWRVTAYLSGIGPDKRVKTFFNEETLKCDVLTWLNDAGITDRVTRIDWRVMESETGAHCDVTHMTLNTIRTMDSFCDGSAVLPTETETETETTSGDTGMFVYIVSGAYDDMSDVGLYTVAVFGTLGDALRAYPDVLFCGGWSDYRDDTVNNRGDEFVRLAERTGKLVVFRHAVQWHG